MAKKDTRTKAQVAESRTRIRRKLTTLVKKAYVEGYDSGCSPWSPDPSGREFSWRSSAVCKLLKQTEL